MAEMVTVEKAGMLVNAAGDVVGWVAAGDEVEMVEGDIVITHHKSAEKAGLLEQFKALKEENKPAKVKKEPTEPSDKKPRVRMEVPTTGAYKVVKEGYGLTDANEGRAAAFKIISECASFEEFFQNAKPYTHVKRDGSAGGEITPQAVMSYAIRHGVIEAVA
jgi:hypothetical protein